MVISKNIHNLSQGPPNPGFMQKKVQKGDFLKKPSQELKNYFCFRFLWISQRPEMLNWERVFFRCLKTCTSSVLEEKLRAVISFWYLTKFALVRSVTTNVACCNSLHTHSDLIQLLQNKQKKEITFKIWMNETLQSFMTFWDMHLLQAMFTKMTLFEVRI